MSKEQILQRIRANKPALLPLPAVLPFESTTVDQVAAFQNMVEEGKGSLVYLSDAKELNDLLAQRFPTASSRVSPLPELNTTMDLAGIRDPLELVNVDVAVLKAAIGVAENGALWLDEKALGQRVLPFIAQHLVVVIERGAIVATMHQAYEQIDIAQTGYGVFVAGPSKTADIEQSLVIGAQGARSLLVVVI